MKGRVILAGAVILALLTVSTAFSQETVAELKERIIDIQNKGELGFANFSMCSNILGYGQYVPIEGSRIAAGSKVFFYYEPVNFFTNRRAGMYQIWFTQDMILKSDDGTELVRQDEALNFNYQTTSPVLDVYVRNTLTLGNLEPGKYLFIAVIHDKYKQVEATYRFPFEIVPGSGS
jgi:hypothetical protein